MDEQHAQTLQDYYYYNSLPSNDERKDFINSLSEIRKISLVHFIFGIVICSALSSALSRYLMKAIK